MTAEDRFVDVLREIDARLTTGRRSPEIAAREQRRGDQVLVYETELDVMIGARTIVLAILERQRIKMWPKPRSRRGVVMIEAPAVFLQEVLLKELDNFDRAFAEYVESAAEEIVFKAFGARIAATRSTR